MLCILENSETQSEISSMRSEIHAERNISEPSGWDFVLEKFNLGLTNIVRDNLSKWSLEWCTE